MSTTKKNKFGLPRDIPDAVKREVRRRSKFGCVICRAGVCDTEHFDPDFADAKSHDPDGMCCLCTSCHRKVFSKHFSKAYVRKKYHEVDAADPADVPAPFDYLDFHDGKAELCIGGINYDPGVTSIVKYHGTDVFSVSPAAPGEAAGINAVFADDQGKETLRIENNVWRGALDAWDIEVEGPRIKVRKKKGAFSLRLRLEPPGRVVIEQLDMRYRDTHILASEASYAVGRYRNLQSNDIVWFHANMVHMRAPLVDAAAVEFLTDYEAEWRDAQWKSRGGQHLETKDGGVVFRTGLGVAWKPLGIIIGANCLEFGVGEVAGGGPRPLAKVRRAVFSDPERLAPFIGKGVW